ncbi:MAG: hypothetical protein CL424_14130 [Acidimicrobiaceae bacterium]|nr:hypothetical protein [Acidimicrobiaceae bacterium]
MVEPFSWVGPVCPTPDTLADTTCTTPAASLHAERSGPGSTSAGHRTSRRWTATWPVGGHQDLPATADNGCPVAAASPRTVTHSASSTSTEPRLTGT